MALHHFLLNGQTVSLEAPEDMPLLWVLRDVFGVTGPKYGCGVGVCGACTSHLNGHAFRPCIQPVGGVHGQRVTTIEGLGGGEALHPVQQAWIDEDAAQCGFCQPGQIMAAVALLQSHPQPTDADIDAAMSDNVCRCGTYVRIRSAIKRAALLLRASPRP
ncbi:ioquinoline 1-oxidoreductase subunit alpha [Cystobacter fuscus]|uniref:Ioquinoline 1-oxidoreductase subunit alpha n=1 Tax=Cystobacter fuscus TaxID=43 RepID=A0A250JE96_9BACT|nr:(2Fe-2S)-binding protein [Cystobacter fuscus]ATB41486.1 ioquinoline 1-oxidoreductase subunit alpha [Cystobacter fuscus]